MGTPVRDLGIVGWDAREAIDEFLEPFLGAADEGSMLLSTDRRSMYEVTQPVRTCEALLKVDLSTLEGLTTCMLALKLSELRNY